MDRPKFLVLITDDDDPIRLLMRDLLSAEGFDCEEAIDGFQCIEKARTIRPTAILLDVNMPIMDGLEACKRLKASPETKDIPVIFVSNLIAREDKEKGLQAGAQSYMGKPVDVTDLVPLLKKLAGG